MDILTEMFQSRHYFSDKNPDFESSFIGFVNISINRYRVKARG